MLEDGYRVSSKTPWKSGSIRLASDRCRALASLSWSEKNSSSDLTPYMVSVAPLQCKDMVQDRRHSATEA